MIRPATHADIEEIVALGRRMHAESRFKSISFVPERLAATLSVLLDGVGCIFVAESEGQIIGGFAGLVTPYYFSNDLYATDLALFVEPNRRGGIVAASLLRTFVEWAKSKGVVNIEISISTGVHPEKTGELYERLGFVRQGANYIMEC